MNNKQKKWDDVGVAFLDTFNKQVPIFSPSVYREYRGEIWTTLHTERHPIKNYLKINDYINHSRFSKSYQGVLRGLHYDFETWKLVQSIMGDIYLVVLDIRNESSTYGMWESYILTEHTREQILIPPGFANGHYALTDCVFHYNLFYKNKYVDTDKQGVIKWNSNDYNIEWPTNNPILQKRDK